MKQRAQEWIDKAEGDWTIAQRERQAANPVWDGICFLLLEEEFVPLEQVNAIRQSTGEPVVKAVCFLMLHDAGQPVSGAAYRIVEKRAFDEYRKR